MGDIINIKLVVDFRIKSKTIYLDEQYLDSKVLDYLEEGLQNKEFTRDLKLEVTRGIEYISKQYMIKSKFNKFQQ
tara:strand:- start:1255 stop:1479 length:225 start_codon:yes stop_codon:yes gene_type:complete